MLGCPLAVHYAKTSVSFCSEGILSRIPSSEVSSFRVEPKESRCLRSSQGAGGGRLADAHDAHVALVFNKEDTVG